jgi:hypothetical protein
MPGFNEDSKCRHDSLELQNIKFNEKSIEQFSNSPPLTCKVRLHMSPKTNILSKRRKKANKEERKP